VRSRKHRLPQYLIGLIDEYLQEYRPILLRSRSEDWLFPGNTPQTLHREQVGDAKNGPSRIRLVVRLSDVAFEGI
jgi:site-specific recombinase XerD